MTNNELIKELVTYDGYKDIGNNTFINDVDNGFLFTISELNEYLIDMNILHRLAVKVKTTIRELLDKSDDTDWELASCATDIIDGMFTSPNPQGEHLQLAEALVNAIRYISENKA